MTMLIVPGKINFRSLSRYIRCWFSFPATLVRGWRGADEILALPPGPQARQKAAALAKLKPRLHKIYRQIVLEDRWMPKSAYFTDGRYQSYVADPWNKKIDQAVRHTAAQ